MHVDMLCGVASWLSIPHSVEKKAPRPEYSAILLGLFNNRVLDNTARLLTCNAIIKTLNHKPPVDTLSLSYPRNEQNIPHRPLG